MSAKELQWTFHLVLILLQGKGQFKGNEPHGLLQQTPLPKRELFVLADEDQLFEHVCHIAQIVAFQFFRIFTVPPIPVLSGIPREIRAILKIQKNILSLLGSVYPAQPDILRGFNSTIKVTLLLRIRTINSSVGTPPISCSIRSTLPTPVRGRRQVHQV